MLKGTHNQTIILLVILTCTSKSMEEPKVYGLKVGDTFDSWEEFNSYFQKYQNSVKQSFNIGGCRTLNESEDTNLACKYDYVKLDCKHGISRHTSRNRGIRETRTTKLDCKSFVRLVITKNLPRELQKLRIESLDLNHTGHVGSENFYELLPEKRSLRKNSQLKDQMNKMLKLKVPVSSIQDEFSKEHGIELLAKDVQNAKQKLKSQDDDKLSQVVKILQDTYVANVNIICGTVSTGGKEDTFLGGIIFSTQQMRDAYSAWPEIVFVDGKYNLLKNKMITILMCVQDGEGHTHVIGVGLAVSEDKPTLRSLFQCLKQSNELASFKTTVFMTDSDLTERSVIKEVFPDCLLLICEFHLLKIFMRKITTAGMKITLAERYFALDLLDKMVKSNSEEEYNYHYKKFSEEAPEMVQEYFNNNYHPIKNEWVRYYMSAGNYGNYTNNPVESQNARLGKLCQHPTTLAEFVHEFFAYQKRKYKAMKHSSGRTIYTRPTKGHSAGTVLYLFEKVLTKKAFEQVATQYNRRKPMSLYEVYTDKKICWIKPGYTILKVTIEQCDCNNFKSDGLPCRHIFAVREHFKLPLFDSQFCPDRFTLQHTVTNHPILQSSTYEVDIRQSRSPLQIHYTPKVKADNVPKRIQMMKVITTSLVNTGALATGKKFEERCALLRAIERKWKNNEEVKLDLTADSLLEISNLSIKEKEDRDNIELDNLDDSVIMPIPVKMIGRPSGANKSTVKKNTKKVN